jgi:hypothetical protein
LDNLYINKRQIDKIKATNKKKKLNSHFNFFYNFNIPKVKHKMDQVYMKTPADDYDIDRINEMLKLVGNFLNLFIYFTMVSLHSSETRKREN